MRYLFLAFILCSCGTQDYETEVAEAEKPIVNEARGWRDAALASRTEAVQIESGFHLQKSIVSDFGFSQTSSCPDDAICFRSKYFGEEQLAHFSTRYPDLVRVQANQSDVNYYIHGVRHLLIETDLFFLDEKVRFRFCGERLSIISSEVSGSGAIDASASGCSDRLNGGSIEVVSGLIDGVKFISNGQTGRNGKDGEITWQSAANGDPNALSISLDLEKQPIQICADSLGCMREVLKYMKPKQEGWEGLGEIYEEAGKVAAENLDYLKRMGVPIAQLESYSSEAASLDLGLEAAAIAFGGGGCFFKSDPSTNRRHTGFVHEMNPVVKGLEELNGEDAKFKSEGEDGESGGDAGKIELVGFEIKVPRIIAEPGKGGVGGKSFVQEPGIGVTPSIQSKEFSYNFYGHFSCEFLPDDKGKVKTYFLRPLEFEIKKRIRLGEAYRFNRVGKIGNQLGHSIMTNGRNPKGLDGKALSVRIPIDGKEGANIEPALIEVPVVDMFKTKLKETCLGCDTPKALEN